MQSVIPFCFAIDITRVNICFQKIGKCYGSLFIFLNINATGLRKAHLFFPPHLPTAVRKLVKRRSIRRNESTSKCSFALSEREMLITVLCHTFFSIAPKRKERR